MAHVAIRTWNSSLFDSSNHKWAYGQLNVSPHAIFFQCGSGESKTSDESTHILYVDFSYITSINKALSSLIFPAITIVTKNSTTYWFSSFQNRNDTYLILQHFFLASLQQNPSEANPSTSLASSGETHKRTKLGSELLKNVHNSRNTLQKAAVSLKDQGDQLRSTALTMEEIHEDLDVAERITGDIDSWLGRWSLPPTNKAEEMILVTNNDIPDVLDVEVLFTQVSASRIGVQQPGVLRVAKDGISIQDMKQKVIQHFKWLDVSRVRVVSPWEIFVTRFLIGQPDLSYGLISINMLKVLRKLEQFAARKMECLNPPEPHHFLQEEVSESSRSRQTKSYIDLSGETPVVGLSSHSNESTFQQQQEKVMNEQVITDAEVSELTATLKDLKSLAIDIQAEQDSQLDSIDRLTDSVTRGSDRLKGINSRVNKYV